MAEALKAGGYKTIHLGKYHLGEDPLKDGYDVNVGGNQSGGPDGGGYFSPWTSGAMKEWSDKYPKGTHRMDVFADQAIRFMKENKGQPLFIHFSPYSVHTRLEPVPEFVDKYKGKDIHATYASMVEKFDEGVGKVLDHLKESGLSNNTLVIFSSENGVIAAINKQKPYRAGKDSYYEGGIREPMIAAWPGRIKAGSSCDTPVCTLDLYPTFLSATSLSKASNQTLDGVDLMPLLQQSGDIAPRALYWHFPIYLQAYKPKQDDARDPLFRTRPGSAMRLGKWKLHEFFEDGAYELYNLENDLGGRKNLAAEMPEKVAELAKKLTNWRESVQAAVPTQLNSDYDPNWKGKNTKNGNKKGIKGKAHNKKK